jgi:hypothetical protein
MLEILFFGTFFIGNEPEQMLFLLYTLMFIWGSAMRALSIQQLFAPHVLDVVAAAKSASDAATCGSAEATASACSFTTATLIEKYCGRTIGDIAATCGIPLAVSAYFDSGRLRIFPPRDKARKRLRRTVSYALGITVDFISDVEDWWAAQSFYKKDSAAATAVTDL